MNELSKFLVDAILTEGSQIERVITVFSGRFQPFHKGHYDNYSKLVKKFGKDNVYIGTSDKVEVPTSPFSFKEKEQIMTKMFGIPKDKIVQVKNPYRPTEILKKYDENTTAVVFFVSEKDANRLGGKYFQPWNGNPISGYKEAGYVYTMPPGSGGLSGTEVRKSLSSDDEGVRVDMFKKLYPKFDKKIYNLITSKLVNEGYIPIHISKEIIEDWIIKKSQNIIQEVSAIGGGGEVDDGPNFMFPNYDVYSKISADRAAHLGFTVVDQIMKKELEDYYEHPKYPKGPIQAVSSYPAGVIGKLTATNQLDFASMEAYDSWFKHVTRKMALVGYSLVHHRDDVERELSTKYLKDLDNIIQQHTGKAVDLSDVDVKFLDMMGENLMIGYEGSDDHKERKKKLKRLRKQLNITTNDNVNETITLTEAQNKLKLNIPKDIKAIHNAFKCEGKKLYVVGGAVRDAILGKSPKDFDLATDAKPDEVLDIAKKYGMKSTAVGKAFGVVLVNGHELATFRKDIGKGRRPDSVDYTDIKGDVKRRDLTINALFYDIERGEIVDLVGGIADLQNNRIRTVGKASERFDEDPLRKLRVLRFASRMGGMIEDATLEALKADPSLAGVSSERIRDEFIKSIQSAKSTKQYLTLADDVKVLQQIFPRQVYRTTNFIEHNDHRFVVAYLLKHNTPKSLYQYLMKIKYPHSEANDIKFLINLLDFDADDILVLKKLQENVTLTDKEIIEWGKITGINLSKFVKFNLSVKGDEVMKMGYTGADIGKQIAKMETERFLNESVTTAKGKQIHTFKELFKEMPSELQKRVYNLKNIPQRPDAHPEGNTLKHTIVVVNRALKEEDIDLAIAAIMHDIGKDETAEYNPKKGFWTAHGHEKVSAKLVKDYNQWIKDMGANVANVYYIVKNHMRYKKLQQMRPGKQKKLKSFRAFDKLQNFSKHDRGGLDETRFILPPGLKFIPKKSFEGIKRGLKYTINAIKGTIGDMTVIVSPLGSSKQITVKVRSLEEFYRYVMMEGINKQRLSEYYNDVLSENIEQRLRSKYNVELYITERPDRLVLSQIIIPESERNKGIGTKIMMELIDYADATGKTLFTTPSSDFGGSKSRLDKFYKSFGFVNNKGRNKDFRTMATLVRQPNSNESLNNDNRTLLLCGGAYGHMSHPFETELNLTFGQLKDIINKALDGELELAKEKTDGQNITVSWIGGELKAARNKSHLKNRGENAMTIAQLASKFAGRGGLTKAYNAAMEDLSNAIGSLTDKQRDAIFDNGAKFMSLEVMYPESVNIIPYGQPLLVFHGTLEFDLNGNAIGEDAHAGRILAGMIQQINKDIQKTYSIRQQPVVKLPKSQDLSKQKSKYISQLRKLQSEFKLSDRDSVQDYHKAWWTDYIEKNAPVKIDADVKKELISRWALDDKSFRLNAKNLEDKDLLKWAEKVDKTDLIDIRKKNFTKFERIFLGVGAELLSFISSALVVNPDLAVQKMKNKLDSVIKDIQKSRDPIKINKLKMELERLEAIGGLDKIVPIEGLVFTGPDGRLLKLTGTFAPLNQIINIMWH